jgi:hypothetical protein
MQDNHYYSATARKSNGEDKAEEPGVFNTTQRGAPFL